MLTFKQHFPINFCIIPTITTIPTTKTAAMSPPLLFSLTVNRYLHTASALFNR